MGWGNSWDSDKDNPWIKTNPLDERYIEAKKEFDRSLYEQEPIPIPQFLNKKPTHDPYTNPNAQLYYECNCGQILDPGTKRFAELNNYASKAGWKIRFGEHGYTPYCVKCGEGVE